MNQTAALVLKIVTAIVLVAAVLFGVYYGVSYFSDANKMAEELETGNQYMEAEDYQSAITAYDQALEYEPENEEVKAAIAHAYVMLAGTFGDSDEAVEAYQKALLYNVQNKNAYWGVANIYEGRADEDNVIVALQTGYDNTQDENMKIKIDNIQAERARIQAEEEAKAAEEAERAAAEEAHNGLLSELLTCFEAGNMDDVKELLRTEPYVDMADEIINSEDSFYYGDKNEAGEREGTGVGVYVNGYYYYGEYSGNVRSGKGVWIRAVYAESSAIGSYIFEGDWSTDMPNGSGTVTSNFYTDKIDSSGLAKQVITGNYTNGLEDGKMSLAGTTKGGSSVKYSYTSAEGIAKQSSKEDSGVKGQYIIAKSSDEKSNLTSDGSKRGVEGFLE